LLKKARVVGTTVLLQANDSWPYMQQTGELLQAMWSDVGCKVNYNIYDAAVLLQKRRAGEFHADSMAGAYRFDPDGLFGRSVLPTAPSTRETSRFRNDKADKLILAARQTADTKQRLALYGEVEHIINAELPMLYTHHLTLLEAGAMSLKYTLRNALIPTLTISGLQFAQLLGGTIIIEQIFFWPGIGYSICQAVVARDYPLLQAGVLVLGTIVVLVNLLVDLMYRMLNPRVRLG
jgi:ABC-type transport system substrate-binding protein